MRHLYTLFALLLFCLPLAGKAQTAATYLPDNGSRLSLKMDKKLAPRLHLSMEEELRMANRWDSREERLQCSVERMQTTAELSYKVLKELKVGIGYVMINSFAQGYIRNSRHRLILDASYALNLGNWQLSWKERFQVTHRTGLLNPYQNPRNLLGLKSRLTLKYKGFAKLSPYGYLELRHVLNAPIVNATYNTATELWGFHSGDVFVVKGDPGWFFGGYKGMYVNRLRTSLGLDWELNKKHRLNFYILIDYLNEKDVDANAEGTRLKSYTRARGFDGSLGVGYEYRF